jgi:hypothetical protein
MHTHHAHFQQCTQQNPKETENGTEVWCVVGSMVRLLFLLKEGLA